jgi:hypothetical protein
MCLALCRFLSYKEQRKKRRKVDEKNKGKRKNEALYVILQIFKLLSHAEVIWHRSVFLCRLPLSREKK